MRTPAEHHEDERGAVLVAVLVVIALLFAAGTVMALAVESNLHTVASVTIDDGIRYAAESAVARGVAGAVALVPTAPGACGPGGQINGNTLALSCFPTRGISASAGSLRDWAMAPGPLTSDRCVTSDAMDLDFNQPGAIWAVVAWRQVGPTPGAVTAWLDTTGTCSGEGGEGGASRLCPQSWSTAGVGHFFSCSGVTHDVWFHVSNDGGTVKLGQVVVRSAISGVDVVTTVVGQAATELDEADVLLPQSGSGRPTLSLWETVLP